MRTYQFAKEYFLNTNDGNALTTDERIKDALKVLVNEGDYIELSSTEKCHNEEELRRALGLIE